MQQRGWLLPLFVPATRPDRFAKAARSGADAVVVDLEDAVAPEEKDAARANVELAANIGCDMLLRINAIDTVWFEADCAVARACCAKAVMLPKALDDDQVQLVAEATGKPVVALIETAEGAARIVRIAAAVGTVQLGLGTQDLAAELGCSPASRLFDALRWDMVAASARAGIAGPIDGVSLDLANHDGLEDEARALVDIGFAGKFCIHPAQIAPLRRGLRPRLEEVERARRIIDCGDGAGREGDIMIDAPVRRQAQRVLDAASRLAEPIPG